MSDRESRDASWCLGWVQGVRETYQILRLLLDRGVTPNVCVPATVSADKLAEIYVKWADEHPESLHEHEGIGLSLALGDALACLEEGDE